MRRAEKVSASSNPGALRLGVTPGAPKIGAIAPQKKTPLLFTPLGRGIDEGERVYKWEEGRVRGECEGGGGLREREVRWRIHILVTNSKYSQILPAMCLHLFPTYIEPNPSSHRVGF